MPYTQEELQLMNTPQVYNGGVGIPYQGGTAKEVGVIRDKYGREYVYYKDEQGNRRSRRQGSDLEQTAQNMRKASDRSYQTESGREIQQGFTEGGDFAGNMIMTTFTTPTIIESGIGALQLLKSGLYSEFAGGLLGSLAGGTAVEKGTELMTGKGFYDHMTESGMSKYNAYTSNPGSWAGGYIGSKVGPYVADVALATPADRITITPNGMIKVPVNEVMTTVETPTLVSSGRTYGPTKYPNRFTNKVVSGKTAADKGVWGGKNTYASRVGETGDIGKRGAGEKYIGVRGARYIGGGANKENILTYTNYYKEPLPIGPNSYPGRLFPPVWSPIPGNNPEGGEIIPPAIVSPIPRPTVRTEEVKFTTSPFIEWFGKQPEGTYQWYDSVPGDPHKTGIYEIIRTVEDPIVVRRRVGTDPQHTNGKSVVANDSTTYEYYNNPFLVPDTGVTILPGAVAPITNIGPDTIPIQGAKDPYNLLK